MTIDRLVIFVAFNTCVVIIYDYDIVTQLGMACVRCQVIGWIVSVQFVLFHNDTRYTRKFKFGIGIAVMVSTNISYEPQLFVKHSNSKSI